MSDTLRGLFISGAVTGRTRRMIGSESPRTVVTYRINDGNNDFFVDEWNPAEFHTVGEIVCLPVYVKVYSRNGVNRLNYVVKSGTANMAGEEF